MVRLSEIQQDGRISTTHTQGLQPHPDPGLKKK
jgi:hypothetical protein